MFQRPIAPSDLIFFWNPHVPPVLPYFDLFTVPAKTATYLVRHLHSWDPIPAYTETLSSLWSSILVPPFIGEPIQSKNKGPIWLSMLTLICILGVFGTMEGCISYFPKISLHPDCFHYINVTEDNTLGKETALPIWLPKRAKIVLF